MEIICQEDIVVQGLMDGPLWNEKYEYGRCAGGGILNSSGFQLHTLIYDDDGGRVITAMQCYWLLH